MKKLKNMNNSLNSKRWTEYQRRKKMMKKSWKMRSNPIKWNNWMRNTKKTSSHLLDLEFHQQYLSFTYYHIQISLYKI